MKNVKKGKTMLRLSEATQEDRAKLVDMVNSKGWKYVSKSIYREWESRQKK